MTPTTIDWQAVGAVSTAAATFVALWASVAAIRAPERIKRADRREGTLEVLRATQEALEIYRGAAAMVENKVWTNDLVILMRIRADHLHATLDRLIGRPSLTDGAIAVGAGAMSILGAIRTIPTADETREIALGRGSNFYGARFLDVVRPAKTVVDSAADAVGVVQERARRVEAYMNRKWHERLRSKFRKWVLPSKDSTPAEVAAS